jgi:hypothetical protein
MRANSIARRSLGDPIGRAPMVKEIILRNERALSDEKVVCA